MPRFVPSYRRENKTLEEARRVRNASPELVEFARNHRQAPTPAEEALWDSLRSQRLNNLKFRRQHPVGTTIFDFYCAAHKLVIELDGGYHDTATQRLRDAERTELQELRGYKVLRFRNEEVLENLPVVLQAIQEAVQAAPLEEEAQT